MADLGIDADRLNEIRAEADQGWAKGTPQAFYVDMLRFLLAALSDAEQRAARAEREERLWLAWSNDQKPDFSPGDVISAELDGTIVLDDGITTWEPLRAIEFFDAKADAENARATKATNALRQIADGNWNFGNEQPGLTVMDFARSVLADLAAEEQK